MKQAFTKENITNSILQHLDFTDQLVNEIVETIWNDEHAEPVDTTSPAQEARAVELLRLYFKHAVLGLGHKDLWKQTDVFLDSQPTPQAHIVNHPAASLETLREFEKEQEPHKVCEPGQHKLREDGTCSECDCVEPK